MCNSWGDPHAYTFDDSNNDVYDAGWYTLSEPTLEAQENQNVPYFRVSQDLSSNVQNQFFNSIGRS